MAKISWKPATLVSPLPAALISSGTVEKPNVMTVSWTGIINSDPVITYVSIRPSRLSHEIISKSKEFVINLTHLPIVEATDFCGVKSGRDCDKFKEAGLTPAKCEKISAPQVLESPVSIECKVIEVKNYGTHDMFIAEVVNVNIDDKYLDDKGRLALEKAGIISYVHGEYYTLGRKIGSFGYSISKEYLKEKEKIALRKEQEADEFFGDEEEVEVEETGNRREFFKPRRESDSRARRDGQGFKPRSDKPFGDRRPSGNRDRNEGGERSFKPRDGQGFKPRSDKPFNDRRPSGNRERNESGERSFKPRDGQGFKPRSDKPFNDRRPSGNRERNEGGERSFKPRDGQGFKPRSDKPFGDRRPSGNRDRNEGGERSFKPRDGQGFKPRGDKPFNDKKSFKPKADNKPVPVKKSDKPRKYGKLTLNKNKD